MTDPGYSGDMNYGGGYGYQPPADPKLKRLFIIEGVVGV